MLNFLNNLKINIQTAFKQHIVFFFIILACLLISIISAIITCVNYFEYFTIKNLTDKLLISYLKNDISIWSLFIRRFFNFLFFAILIYLLCCSKYSAPFSLIIICFLAFNLVLNIFVFIRLFGFWGAVVSIIVFLLIGLILLATLIIFSLLCLEYSCHQQNLKCYFNLSGGLGFIFLTLMCVFLVLAILELILLPICSSVIIIVF